MVGFGKMENNDQISEIKNEVFQLMSQKTRVENEIEQLFQILGSNNIGMHDSLVDAEGFPRNDIDLYQVRTTRHKIICLRNDLKNLMILIEKGIHKIHAGAASSTSAEDEPMDEGPLPEPFASVTIVSPGSPADLCGLKVSDIILEFGSVNKSNFKSMQDLACVVRHSAGQKVSVLIRRKGRNSTLSLDLVPQPWSGQGLIGCKIEPLPIETIER